MPKGLQSPHSLRLPPAALHCSCCECWPKNMFECKCLVSGKTVSILSLQVLVSLCKHIKHCDQKTKHALNRDMFERWGWKRHGDSCRATKNLLCFLSTPFSPTTRHHVGTWITECQHATVQWERKSIEDLFPWLNWRFVPRFDVSFGTPVEKIYIPWLSTPFQHDQTRVPCDSRFSYYACQYSNHGMIFISTIFMFSIFMWPPASPALPHTLNPAGSRRHPRWDELRVVTNQKVTVFSGNSEDIANGSLQILGR